MNNDIMQGDIVSFKSNQDLKMTADRMERGVFCVWFEGKDDKSSFYPKKDLVAIERTENLTGSDFSVGMLVRLKSGSPDMRVQVINGLGIFCSFKGKRKEKGFWISPSSLQIIS